MAAKKRKQSEEEPAGGAPEWIVTFSDMVSLLVTFFVMLMSFSTMDDREEMLITTAFNNQGSGVVVNLKGHSAVEPPRRDHMLATHPRRGALKPHVRPDEELLENIEEMWQKATEEHLEIDFGQALDGLQISFGPEASFSPGSAEVSSLLRARLLELAQVLEHYGHLVVVEGFTDTEFEPTPMYPSAEALSAARANAAARIMVAGSGLGPDVIQVAGLGASRPREANDTAAGRTANRRVEVRVLSMSRARAQQLEKLRAELEGN
jgi:chemotaxis protein MotB